MKTVQWLALALVMLLVAELLVVPEGADGWGRRRRRRRRRWFARRRASSRRRRSWFRKAVSTVGRGLRKVGRFVHKVATSKITGYIATGVGFINGAIGTACCTGGLLTGPPGIACCGVTRGIAGGLCALGTYRTVHQARQGKALQATISGAGAAGQCVQAATGVSTFGHAKKAFQALRAGRKKRETSAAQAKCGARYLAADLAKIKMMTCAVIDLRRTCASHQTSKETNRVHRVILAIKALISRSIFATRKPSLIKSLKDTKCRMQKYMPICAPTLDEASKTSFEFKSSLYDPSSEPCRLVSPRERSLDKKSCRSREAYAFMHMQKFANHIMGDFVKMYPNQGLKVKDANKFVTTVKTVTPMTGR